MALKLAHSAYFYLGLKSQTRDSIARVLPYYSRSIPLYNYLYGMYAFGLTQTNQLDQAVAYARKGLDLNRHDAWASHAISHVNEYSCDYKTGIAFLESTESDWNVCNFLTSHNYWHLGKSP